MGVADAVPEGPTPPRQDPRSAASEMQMANDRKIWDATRELLAVCENGFRRMVDPVSI